MKTKFIIFLILTICNKTVAQDVNGIYGSENWLQGWTNFKPIGTEYKSPNVILIGRINQNTTLYKKNIYLLNGNVCITDNAVLTIEPGTLIRGDFETCGTLIITKGAKLIAEGQETNPIVFTSSKEPFDRKSGDWGGIIILGEAPINKFGNTAKIELDLSNNQNSYGAENENSNSGMLKYVRIEFAGRKDNKLYNGLTLAGVGNKTVLENIMVSYSNEDSFKCLGGNFNLNNMVSFKASDDDIDFNQGTQCIINNSLLIRYPYFSRVGDSRALEISSFDKIQNMDFTKKLTTITATNLTIVNNEDNNSNLIKEAVLLKHKSNFNLSKSVVCGFNNVVTIAESDTNLKIKTENLFLKSNLFSDCKEIILDINDDQVQKESHDNYLESNQLSNTKYDLLFNENQVKSNPDFRMRAFRNFAVGK